MNSIEMPKDLSFVFRLSDEISVYQRNDVLGDPLASGPDGTLLFDTDVFINTVKSRNATEAEYSAALSSIPTLTILKQDVAMSDVRTITGVKPKRAAKKLVQPVQDDEDSDSELEEDEEETEDLEEEEAQNDIIIQHDSDQEDEDEEESDDED